MMRFFAILVVSLVSSIGACSQTVVTDSDRVAFERHLSETFAEYYPVQLLQRMYRQMDAYAHDSVKGRYVLSDFGNSEGNCVAADHSEDGPQMTYTPTRMVGKVQGFAATDRHYDDRAFPDSLRQAFKSCFSQLRHDYPNKRKWQKSMLSSLTAFKKEAKHMPMFFAEVQREYGDNLSLYVKDLFHESVLLDGSQYQRFLRRPSATRLLCDKGVQFVMGIALYRLWLEGRSAATDSGQ